MCLQWSVLRTSDVSPKCCARYIFLLFVNKFGDVIGLVTVFIFFILMSRKWQLTLYMAFLMPWTFELKMNDIFCCPFCYLGNYLGSVQFYFSVLMFLPEKYYMCYYRYLRIYALIWLAYLTFCFFLQSKPINCQKLRQRPLPMPSILC